MEIKSKEKLEGNSQKPLIKFKEHEAIHAKLDFFIQTNNIPHIIFYGTSGSGKRTILYDFLNKIYRGDKTKIKNNVMFVNCSYGKGIKFIREDLKFFAKTNIQFNSGISFKSIVLLNADNLTMDAQSALRRSIELFSHNTRFFIVVENKHKLLNPILSRFCEMYIPEVEDPVNPGKYMNLYKPSTIDPAKYIPLKRRLIECMKTPVELIELCGELYNQAISARDIVQMIEIGIDIQNQHSNINTLVYYEKIKSEIRCEKMLMFFLMDFMYLRETDSLKKVCFI
jgi:DNA polymerase III delta prime subunit